MDLINLKIKDVFLIIPDIHRDNRGIFIETWHKKKFKEIGIELFFVQDNFSRSVKNTLRGLHYQINQAQGKLVKVTNGKVFDVAVDMRKSSSTYGQWVGELLSSDNNNMLWIPPGFAHGFYVLSEFAEVTYKCTDYYAPEYERTIIWDDKDISINWPIDNNTLPLLSTKDAEGKTLKSAETYP